jgi:accessory gene regulator B
MEITFYRKLADKAADAVLSSHDYTEAEKKKIRYGLVCIFSDLYKTILFLFVFSIFSLTKEFILAFLPILLLRPFLGGYHAKDELACIFMSLFMLIISTFTGKLDIIPLYIQLFLIIILPLLALLMAPVRIKEKVNGGIGTKSAAVFLTIILLLADYFIFPSQIILCSVIEVYLLAIYQLIINKIQI